MQAACLDVEKQLHLSLPPIRLLRLRLRSTDSLPPPHPTLQRCNFPDQVLTEPAPPLPRCSVCNRAVDTHKDGHSYGPDGLTCMRCAGF